MKKNKFKAAVIGVGNIGADEGKFSKEVSPGTHAGSYNINIDTELSAFVDVNKKNLKSACIFFPGVKSFSSIKEMMKKEKPDIVSISTPTKFHCENVLEVAKFGCKAIICEKPIAYLIKDAKKMISVCKDKKIKLFVNHQRHFDPLLQKWGIKIQKDKCLGELYQGHAYYYNGLYNNGTHLVDLLSMFVGKIVSVEGIYNKKTSSNKNDLNIDGFLFFKNGAIVSLHSLSKNYGYFSFSIFGEKGMIEVSNLGYQIKFVKKVKNKNYKGFYSLSSNALIEGKERSMFIGTIIHVVSCLLGKVKPINTGEDGLYVLMVLDALNNSARFGGKKVFLKNL